MKQESPLPSTPDSTVADVGNAADAANVALTGQGNSFWLYPVLVNVGGGGQSWKRPICHYGQMRLFYQIDNPYLFYFVVYFVVYFQNLKRQL